MLRPEYAPCLPTRGNEVPAGPDWLHEFGTVQLTQSGIEIPIRRRDPVPAS